MATVIDLGQKVKAKYPGAYDDLTDEEVGLKVRAKYPEYSDFTDVEKPREQPSFFGSLVGGLGQVVPTLGNVAIGAAKGLASTAAGASQLGEKALSLGRKPESEMLAAQVKQSGVLEPKNLAQRVGFGSEKVAEFLLPSPAGKSGLLARAGMEALKGGTTSAIQSGEVGQEQALTAAASGAIPLVGAGLGALGRKTAVKIENSLVRPTAADIKDGFKTQNVFKYDVGGSLQQTAEKVHEKIASLSDELRAVIGSSGKKLNLFRLLDDTARELSEKKASTFGANTKIQNAVNHFKAEIAALTKNGSVDLATAQDVKRSTGKIGAWVYGSRDPEATAMEKVANALYSKLKSAIESASPQQIKSINSQLSELIPIENAVIRRLPVAERQNIVGLMDAVTAIPAFVGNPSSLWLTVLNRVLRSGRVAERLYKGAPGAGAAARGALGLPAAASTVEQP